MIIRRYLRREVLQTFIAVTGVLMLIFTGRHFARYLGDAAAGEIPGEIVFQLLFYLTLGSTGMLLPFALFVAVLLAFGRLYKDNEMTALAACGVSTRDVVVSMGALGAVCAVVVLGMNLYVTPWSAERAAQVREGAATASELEGIRAAHFNQSGAERVFYVERVTDDKKSMQNIFVQQTSDDQLVIFAAQSGHQFRDSRTGERYMVLVDGYRYQGTPGTGTFVVQQYQTSGVRVEDKPLERLNRRKEAIPSATLWASDSPRDQAELQWRIAMPIVTVLLAVLGVLLSRTSPRQGRFAKLFGGIMIFVIYNNGLAVARTWTEQGIIPVFVGLWWVHLAMLALLFVIWQRQDAGFAAPRRVVPR